MSASFEEAANLLKVGSDGLLKVSEGPWSRLSREGTEKEEIFAKTTTPDGWEVEVTSMYITDDRCVMGAPYLKAVYRDARRLLRQHPN